MKKQYIITFLAFVIVLVTACKDDDLAPIATFEASEKGAYVRLIDQQNSNVNLTDIENSKIVYNVEFVDLEKGNLVSEYSLQLLFEDNNPANGDNSTGLIDFGTWTPNDFTTNQDGFVGLENIQITATDAIDAVGIKAEDILSGDVFKFQGKVTTTSGQTFNQANSSASVNGNSFRGFFNFSMNAFCPSNLEGTYAYTSIADSIACPNGTNVSDDLTGSVNIIALGNGVYNINDWSFGAYTACYGAGNNADSRGLQFTETCMEVGFTGVVDGFGEQWSFNTIVDGNEWIINWENTFNEKGSTVLINENGWNFTMEE